VHHGAQWCSDGRADMIVGDHQLPVFPLKNYAGVAMFLAGIFEISPVSRLELMAGNRSGNTLMLQIYVGCVIADLIYATVVFITEFTRCLQTIKKHIGTG
jgi:hypothetical protein